MILGKHKPDLFSQDIVVVLGYRSHPNQRYIYDPLLPPNPDQKAGNTMRTTTKLLTFWSQG